jgi:two-component system response regulator
VNQSHTPPPARPVLLVDDSPEELLLMQLGLKRAGVTVPQVTAGSGDEALDYLLGRGGHAGRDTGHLPILTLMDLHMPGKSGIDTLREIRAQPQLADLKVVMFSSSDEPGDIELAHDVGANSFICKPLTAYGMQDVIRQIRERWLDVDLTVPPAPPHPAA